MTTLAVKPRTFSNPDSLTPSLLLRAPRLRVSAVAFRRGRVEADALKWLLPGGEHVAFVGLHVGNPFRGGRDVAGGTVVVPDGAEGEGLELFLKREPGREVAGAFGVAEGVGGLEEGFEQGLEHGARADDPGGDA